MTFEEFRTMLRRMFTEGKSMDQVHAVAGHRLTSDLKLAAAFNSYFRARNLQELLRDAQDTASRTRLRAAPMPSPVATHAKQKFSSGHGPVTVTRPGGEGHLTSDTQGRSALTPGASVYDDLRKPVAVSAHFRNRPGFGDSSPQGEGQASGWVTPKDLVPAPTDSSCPQGHESGHHGTVSQPSCAALDPTPQGDAGGQNERDAHDPPAPGVTRTKPPAHYDSDEYRKRVALSHAQVSIIAPAQQLFASMSYQGRKLPDCTVKEMKALAEQYTIAGKHSRMCASFIKNLVREKPDDLKGSTFITPSLVSEAFAAAMPDDKTGLPPAHHIDANGGAMQ